MRGITTGTRRVGLTGVFGALGVLAVAGPAVGSGETITVYSGQHDQTVSLLVKDFEKRTDVKVSVRSGDEAELANQILQEGSGSPADVFFAENPPALEALRGKGLLSALPATVLRVVPKRYSSPQGNWLGVSARSVALSYNVGQVPAKTLPKSVLDLASSAWKGRVGFAPTETDFQPVVTAVIRLKGSVAARRWLEGIRANGKVYPDNEALVAAVNDGRVGVGLLDHYYWYRFRDEVSQAKTKSRLHYFRAGDPGALVDVSGVAVLQSSSRKASANRFLAYLVSPAGQRIIATSESYEYPLRPGIGNPRLTYPLSALRPPRLSMTALGDGRETLALLQDVGLL